MSKETKIDLVTIALKSGPMRATRLRYRSVIEVGDWLNIDSGMGSYWYTIKRVTPARAFYNINSTSEGCVQREIAAFDTARPVPKLSLWNRAQYVVYRPIPKA